MFCLATIRLNPKIFLHSTKFGLVGSSNFFGVMGMGMMMEISIQYHNFLSACTEKNLYLGLINLKLTSSHRCPHMRRDINFTITEVP